MPFPGSSLTSCERVCKLQLVQMLFMQYLRDRGGQVLQTVMTVFQCHCCACTGHDR